MAQGHRSPSRWLRHPACGGGKVTVTRPGPMAGMSCSAMVAAKCGLWLEKQMHDGLSPGVRQGTGWAERLDLLRKKGIFGRRSRSPRQTRKELG